jgi:hypothetical protein
MKKVINRSSNYIYLGLLCYLLLVFAVIIPLHHHDLMEQDHHDCAICSITLHPASIGSVILLTVFMLIWLALPKAVLIEQQPTTLFHLRGPPVA